MEQNVADIQLCYMVGKGWDEGALLWSPESWRGKLCLENDWRLSNVISSPLFIKLQVGGITTASMCSTLAVQVNLVPGK